MAFDQNQRFVIGRAPIARVCEWMPDNLLVRGDQAICVPLAHRILARSDCRTNKPCRSLSEGGSASASAFVFHSAIAFQFTAIVEQTTHAVAASALLRFWAFVMSSEAETSLNISQFRNSKRFLDSARNDNISYQPSTLCSAISLSIEATSSADARRR